MKSRQTILGIFAVVAVAAAPTSIGAASLAPELAALHTGEQDTDKGKGTADKAADATKEAAEKTKDAVVKGTTVAVEKTKDGLSKTGEVITDAWITTRVHARFVDEALLKNSDISVDADNHVVTLKGTVLTKAGRTRATTIAKGTEGVRSVVNHLTIGPKRG